MKPALFFEFFGRRPFLVLWISILVYIFYDNLHYYQHGRQFLHLRNILGFGLCISRGTAAIINVSSALVLLPLCKKLNQLLYLALSKLAPRLFFLWLENAKTFHMTVGATIAFFSVIHSCSHFVNMWNFSRNYNEENKGINVARYKNQSVLSLLATQPGVTGVAMLLIISGMGLTSTRMARRRCYNTFWYTHQMYFVFLVLLLMHPLSGVLKEQVAIDVPVSGLNYNATYMEKSYHFVSIKSKTWSWMAIPLTFYAVDLLWRLITRNSSKIILTKVERLRGRVLSLTMRCDMPFRCRAGQYILLQFLDISLLEWHPFTVVKIPKSSQDDFNVWIRVKGDWTEQLENLLDNNPDIALGTLNILLDGPFCSPMEEIVRSDIAICVAAGVGVTPFVSILHSLYEMPRNRYPGRIHLIWIVRFEHELTWLAQLANNTIVQLINANRPDRLNIQFYVTHIPELKINKENSLKLKNHIITINDTGGLKHIISKNEQNIKDEKLSLLTPNIKRLTIENNISKKKNKDYAYIDSDNYRIVKEYPLLGCRLRKGRPDWDTILNYWVHLYPDHHLNVFCCGPKKLTRLLRNKCYHINKCTKTKFSFINEGFS